jgi:hypothetical protein
MRSLSQILKLGQNFLLIISITARYRLSIPFVMLCTFLFSFSVKILFA